jgi:SET domain-containing protein
MMMVKTYLGASKINGFGLFAKEDVKAHTLMWQFVPNFDLELAAEVIESLAPDFIKHYGSKVEPNIYLLCGDNARFMNHSENPNMSGAGGQNFALRDIRAGEEITCNYREFDLEFKGF